jgi:arylsulfatase A-like enzyme/Tfp pilus assembly protein PilF
MLRSAVGASATAAVLLLFALTGWGEPGLAAPPAQSIPKPLLDLLLVTLDTTRADAVSPEAAGVTPNLERLAAGGIRFSNAYSTVPTTFSAHASMMSGLLPAGHGVHENGRHLRDSVPLLAERLRDKGYATAAFVSGFPLQRQFGLARGFELYDDAFGAEKNERDARATTDLALAWLAAPSGRPRFLWVHYYDPHEPYEPPEPFRSRFASDPYRGEVAYMDRELGRLASGFESGSRRGFRIAVVADHGEGRGDHGEALHGNLLYQGVMRVPLVVAGDGIAPAVRSDAVSIRQIRDTFLEWAGDPVAGALSAPKGDVVLGEAMQPYLDFRWQPQVMAVNGTKKLIRSGRFEIYELADDPGELRDLAGVVSPDRNLAKAVADYPLPAADARSGDDLGEEERRRLASLGYIASSGAPSAVPPNAPRAAEMTDLFAELDGASRDYATGDYAAAVPRFRRILERDPGNLMAAIRLAVCQSSLGQDEAALASFARARSIDPASSEAKLHLAVHHLKQRRPAIAEPLFEQVLAMEADRLIAIDGLAGIRARQGRLAEAAELYERAISLSRSPAPFLVVLSRVRAQMGDARSAIAALERARTELGPEFKNDLELGALYLAVGRNVEARDELDRVPVSHPGYAMALFHRAQVSVLLQEPDRAERVRAALAGADARTRALIANERLFADLLP